MPTIIVAEATMCARSPHQLVQATTGKGGTTEPDAVHAMDRILSRRKFLERA
jgi:hypothetical protein